ncbi:MAG: hypothetical protein U0T83_06310 [Bacteriovoracaceae bacterium]
MSNESNTYVTAVAAGESSTCPGDTDTSTAVECRDNGNLRADLLSEYTNPKLNNYADTLKPMIVPFAATMGLNMFNLFFAAFSAPFLLHVCHYLQPFYILPIQPPF